MEAALAAETREWVEQVRQKRDALDQETRRSFGTDLFRAMTDAGLKFTGHYPRFQSELIAIRLDPSKNLAEFWLGHDGEKLPLRASHKVDDIVASVRKAQTYLNAGSMTADRWTNLARRVFVHYPRPSYPIIEFLGLFMLEMARDDKRFRAEPTRETFADYSRAQFSFDLHRFNSEVIGVMKLVTATRLETDSREKYLWVPTGDLGSHFSRIEPREKS